MELKNKIYSYMQNHNAFDNNMPTTVETVFKGIHSSSISRAKIRESIEELIENGTVIIKNGIIKNNTKVFTGQFLKRNNGTGVVVVKEEGLSVEYFVPTSFTLRAGNKDKASFVLEQKPSGEKIAHVVSIISSPNDLVYGIVKNIGEKTVFIPDDKRYSENIELVQNEFTKKALNKRCSVHLILKDKNAPLAQITSDAQIFGFINNPMVSVASILEESGVPLKFSQDVHNEISNIGTKVKPEELVDRTDFRDKKFVTIDPATCKDMDDAVYVEELYKHGVPVGYKLYVAIADVSHYIPENSTLDKEAFTRGTSIYPAGTVVPMLPEKLSNGICSLNPNDDRLAVVTTIDITKNGKIIGYDIYNGVINSKHKFAYEEVSALHNNETEAVEKFGEFKPTIDMLYNLSDAIGRFRKKQGTLTIQGYEPTIVLNNTKDRVKDYRNDNYVDSHKVIEHAMVANNEVIATFLNELGIANICRAHEEPTEQKAEMLFAKLAQLGLDIEGEVNNKTYQQIIDAIDEGQLSKVMHTLVVRSMKRACYSTDQQIGHFALAIQNYTHFTSPIRRYVDLIEHRLIKKALTVIKQTIQKNNLDATKSMSELAKEVRHYSKKELEAISMENALHEQCFHLNQAERTADEISEKTDRVCAVLYMQERVGTIQSGYISKIEKDAVTLTLYNENDLRHSHIIEVTLPMSELPKSSKYHLDENACALMENGSNRTVYQLGEVIEIKVMSADPNTQTILVTPDLQKELEQEDEVEKTA